MDTSFFPPLSKRVGFALIAAALALSLVSVAAGNPSFANFFTNAQPTNLAPQSYLVLCCGNQYATPQQSYLFNFSAGQFPLQVYLLRENISGISLFSGNLSSFQADIANQRDLIANYTIAPLTFQVIYYTPSDVEFLSVAVTNPYNSTMAFGYNSATAQIRLPETVGIDASIPLFVVGFFLAALGILFERRGKARPVGTTGQ